jgi:2-desacetyl-2-hydroxyethyl bacteriochlorophyllide A dehydrogenase
MKAMVLKAPGELALEEVARPVPGPGQMLIRVSHTGICGTDYKIYNGGIPVTYPRIMGHEMVGVVVDGNGAFRSGDRVVIDPELYCGACFNCRNGQTQLCPNGALLGRDADGGFAEYVTAPATHVFRLPDSIDDRTASVIQVLTTCLHAQRLINIFPGQSVVIIGLGVTGLLHAQLAKARGAHPIIGVELSETKREMALKMGVDVAFPGGKGATEKVLEATGNFGADLVIECTGVMACLADAINMVRIGGQVLHFGITTATEGALPFYQLYLKEIAIIHARAAKSEDFPSAIGLIQQGAVQVKPLVSHVLPLGDLKKAIGMVGSFSDEHVKIVIGNT